MSSPLFEGGDELQGMPVRRRGDDDGLQAGDGEQLAIVLEGLRAFVLAFLDFVGRLREMFAIDIAQGDDFDAAGLERGLDIDHAVPAAADEAELEGGRSGTVSRAKKTGHGRGTRHGRTEKLPAIKRFHGSPPDCLIGLRAGDIITAADRKSIRRNRRSSEVDYGVLSQARTAGPDRPAGYCHRR